MDGEEIIFDLFGFGTWIILRGWKRLLKKEGAEGHLRVVYLKSFLRSPKNINS